MGKHEGSVLVEINLVSNQIEMIIIIISVMSMSVRVAIGSMTRMSKERILNLSSLLIFYMKLAATTTNFYVVVYLKLLAALCFDHNHVKFVLNMQKLHFI